MLRAATRPARVVNRTAAPPYDLDRNRVETQVRVDTYRASGPGGQHVNRTESAVRLTHYPSGVVVTAADTRSQLRNREIAFARLIERLRALNRIPKKRRPTRPSAGARARRLAAKKLHGRRKRERGRVADE